MFEKYEDGNYVSETSEQFNQLAKDMARVELGDAGKAGELVKSATKELGLMNVEKKGLKKIPLIAKLSNKANNVLIDSMTAEQVLVRYEKELLDFETQAKLSKEDIKRGIERNKQIAVEVDQKVSEVEADIQKLTELTQNGEAIVEDVPGTMLNRLQSYAVTLQQQKADAQSRTIQYSVQLVLAENILTGYNDVRLSVTTTLRDSIMQSQIIQKQEEYIKSIGDAKELIRNVKEDNAQRLNTMVSNASSDIYQYEKDAETIKKIADINFATITSLNELNESVAAGRKLLQATFVEIEENANNNAIEFNKMMSVAQTGDNQAKLQLLEEKGTANVTN